jgi:hypothetical protein
VTKPSLRIGVTGHREVADSMGLRAAVRQVLDGLRRYYPDRPFCIYSALAEGADRLVVEEALAHEQSQFTAVLPLVPAEYARDFQTTASRQAFDRLLGRAVEIISLAGDGSRGNAYRRAGYYVVDHSDVLIACWNGEAARGPGGTADVVAYARQRGHPLVWIRTGNQLHGVQTLADAEDGRIIWERLLVR